MDAFFPDYMKQAGLDKSEQDILMSYYNGNDKGETSNALRGLSSKQLLALVTDIKEGKYSEEQRKDIVAYLYEIGDDDYVISPEVKTALQSLSSGIGEGENAGKGSLASYYLALNVVLGGLLTANFNQGMASFDTNAAKEIIDTYFKDPDLGGDSSIDEDTLKGLENDGVKIITDAKADFDLYNTHLNEIWDLASDMEKNNWIYENVDGKWKKVNKGSVSHDEAWISAKKYLGYTKHSGPDYVPTEGKDYIMINNKPQIMGGIGVDTSDTSGISYSTWFRGDHVGGYEIGLNKVPYDNFPALLHKGERVLTAADVSLDDIGRDSLHSVFEKTNNVINNVMQTNTTNSNTDVTDAIDSQTNSVVKQLNDIIILLGNLVSGMTNTVYSSNPFSVDSITARTGSIVMGQAINAIS